MKKIIALGFCALTLSACHCQDTTRMTNDMRGFRTYSAPVVTAKLDQMEQAQRPSLTYSQGYNNGQQPRTAPQSPAGVTIYPVR